MCTYETGWDRPLLQSYGGFWPWSLSKHPPQHKNAFRGVRGVGGGPPGAFFRTFFEFFTKTPLSVYKGG